MSDHCDAAKVKDQSEKGTRESFATFLRERQRYTIDFAGIAHCPDFVTKVKVVNREGKESRDSVG